MECEVNKNSHQNPKRNKAISHSQNPSTSMQDSIPLLPPELITEILSRLPVKSLLKFRCVSKSWLALISSPEFINTHLIVSANNKEYLHHRLMLSFVQPEYNLKDCSLGSLLDGNVTEAFDLDYPMKIPHKSVWIVGSVNGLICLAIEENDLFIWNPSIRKFKKLPDSRPMLRCGYYFMYGFGYDKVYDDYKEAPSCIEKKEEKENNRAYLSNVSRHPHKVLRGGSEYFPKLLKDWWKKLAILLHISY
ncbi:hypothetical protein CQW23_22866 [Capsicum baccatum]|uniref:F-box domain-containing protein n=1 Tax=Capsicum baccatum TaxID=33114 RepID=A0A2G2W267_CAPBA|nr:hypothetical protein CQW23_22866 [Capsicum baccatum]